MDTMDRAGDTGGENDSARLSEYFGWKFAHSLRGEPASSRRRHSMTRSDVEMRFEAGHPPRCEKRGGEASGMVFRRRFLAKLSMARTGRATSRRFFVISLLLASIRGPAAVLQQSGPASSAWQEHHELPLTLLLHGLPTGCTTCGLG